MLSKGDKMTTVDSTASSHELKDAILSYVSESRGLEYCDETSDFMTIRQSADSKVIKISFDDISKILKRKDSEGRLFLQINFKCTKKLLLTETLVGFKPYVKDGLEMNKIPKIVTTPDLLNVIEAIEEVLDSPTPDWVEVDVLKKLFYSVLEGAEDIGFDLSRERTWVAHMGANNIKASA